MVWCLKLSRGKVVTEPWIDAEWIRNRLHITGNTQKALAHALNLDPSAVSRLLDGTRQIKPHEIPRIMEFFQNPGSPEQPVESGVRTIDYGERQHGAQEALADRHQGKRRRYRAPSGPRPKAKAAPDLPILGPLVADPRGFYALEVGEAERRPAPPQLTGVTDAYALFIPDDRLAPRYRAGEVIYIHPSRPATVGSFVVVRFRSPAGKVVIGEVISADAKSLGLRVGSPDERRSGPSSADLTVNMAEIGQIGRIVVTSTE
jgi:SOS-response transcriptional repressor LexA